MAKVGLTTGFTLIPEGEYVFRINSCEYKEKFGKITVVLENAKGQTIKENYNIENEGGANAFSYLAKTALQDYSLTEIDHEEIVGCFIRARVEHTVQPHRDDPNKTVTFANLKDKAEADGFEDAAIVSAAPKETPKPSTGGKKVVPNLDFLGK